MGGPPVSRSNTHNAGIPIQLAGEYHGRGPGSWRSVGEMVEHRPCKEGRDVSGYMGDRMIFRRRHLALAALAATALCATGAQATIIDFNTAPDAVASYTISGVTFTAEGGGTLYSTTFGPTPNGTRGLIAQGNSAFVPTRATFAGGATSVSIDLGDFNSDADALFLWLYDAGNVLLASASANIPASFTGLVTLSASASGTAYAVFGGVGFNNESNVYGDNFTFDGGAVPEPAAWALMLVGFGGLGAALRSRRRTALSAA